MNYITDQIVSKLQAAIQKKNKKMVIKPHQIKANLWIFVNCLVENPAFDSQTKETLNTKSSDFGSKIELTEKFLKGILDSGVVDIYSIKQLRYQDFISALQENAPVV